MLPWKSTTYYIILCVCVVLFIQYVKHMRRNILSHVTCPAVPYFPTLSHKRYDFRKKKKIHWTQNVCFDFLYSVCLKNFSFYEELSEMWSKGLIGVHVKYLLLLSEFNKTWIFSTDSAKILKYQISWKSVKWEPSCSMRTDGTDMKLRAAFRKFANAPRNDGEVEIVVTRWLITQVRELSNRVQRRSCHDMTFHLSLRPKKG